MSDEFRHIFQLGHFICIQIKFHHPFPLQISFFVLVLAPNQPRALTNQTVVQPVPKLGFSR